jgi:hypothetical protein
MSFASGVAKMRGNDVDRQLFASSPYAGWHRNRHSRHSQQIVRSHGELELLIDPLQPAKHGCRILPTVLAQPNDSSIRLRMIWLIR